jgi:hypothetical protein
MIDVLFRLPVLPAFRCVAHRNRFVGAEASSDASVFKPDMSSNEV